MHVARMLAGGLVCIVVGSRADAAPAPPNVLPEKPPPVKFTKPPPIPKPPAAYKPTPPTPGRTIVKIAANDARDIHTIIKENRKPGVILQLPPKVYSSSGSNENPDVDAPFVDDFTIETTGAAGSTVIDCGNSQAICQFMRGNRNAVRGVEIRGSFFARGSLRLEFARTGSIQTVRGSGGNPCDELSVQQSKIDGLGYVHCKRVVVLDSQFGVGHSVDDEYSGIKFYEYAVFERNRITVGVLFVRPRDAYYYYGTGPLRVANNRLLEGAGVAAFSGSPTLIEGNELTDANEYGIRASGWPGSRISGNTITNTVSPVDQYNNKKPGVALLVKGSMGAEISKNKIVAAERGIVLTWNANTRLYANSVSSARQSALHLENSTGSRIVHNTLSAGSYGAVLLEASHDTMFLNNAFFAPIAAAGELPTTFGQSGGNCAAYGNDLPPMPATGGGEGPTLSGQCRAITTVKITDKLAPGFPTTDLAGKTFPSSSVAGASQ